MKSKKNKKGRSAKKKALRVKKAAKSFRQPEIPYRDFFESARDILYTLTPEGKITFVNQAAEAITGWPQSRNVGRNFRELIHPDDWELAASRLIRALSGSKEPPMEIRIRTKSGEYRVGELLGSPLTVKGKPAGLFGIARDINERKHNELALRYQARLEKIISDLSTYFINIRLSELDSGIAFALQEIGGFLEVDRACLFQFSRDGASMSNSHEWCAEGIEPQKQNLQNLAADSLRWCVEPLRRQEVFHLPWVSEFPIRNPEEKRFFKDQTVKSVICIPIRSSRKLAGFLGFDAVRAQRTWDDNTIVMLQLAGEIFGNLLERKEMEEALRKSELQYRLTLDAMSDMIHMVDRDLKFTLINQAFQKMNRELGLASEVIGKTVREVFPFLTKTIFEEYQTVISTGKPLVTEEFNQIGGRAIYTQTLKIPILERGQVVRIVTVIRDITDWKRSEATLREAKETSQTLIQLLPDAMLAMDLEFKIRDISRRTLELHGYDRPEELLGKSGLVLIAPESRGKVLEVHQRILKEGFVREAEVFMVRKDGAVFPAQMSVALVRDLEGNPKGSVGVAREVKKPPNP